MDLRFDRRTTRSGLTRTALDYLLRTLRQHAEAELALIATAEGLALAWSGDTRRCVAVAAAAPTPELGERVGVDADAIEIHAFELEGTRLLLCVAGTKLEAPTIEWALRGVERIWATTRGNGLGLAA